ncbi:MAG TPA: ribbon-helix-helix domain-containing protein [Thermodesulfobacteriota bacterium]|nr:ribbon-helix-helix domain-containing protein [Thermodesulfobacteriota bacterium]
MKTAISIPDPIFEAAEKLSQRLGISRSELYAKAISSYVQKHREEGITEALNKVYDKEESSLDPVIENLQFNSLKRNEW